MSALGHYPALTCMSNYSYRALDNYRIFSSGPFKETRPVTIISIFLIFFSFKIICKDRIKLCFHNKYVQLQTLLTNVPV